MIKPSVLSLFIILAFSFQSSAKSDELSIQWLGEKPNIAQRVAAEIKTLSAAARSLCGAPVSPLTVVLYVPERLASKPVGGARLGKAFIVIDPHSPPFQRREMVAHEIAHLYLDGGRPPKDTDPLQEAFAQAATLLLLKRSGYLSSFRALRGLLARRLLTHKAVKVSGDFYRYVYLPAALLAASKRVGLQKLISSYKQSKGDVRRFVSLVKDNELEEVLTSRATSPRSLLRALYQPSSSLVSTPRSRASSDTESAPRSFRD